MRGAAQLRSVNSGGTIATLTNTAVGTEENGVLTIAPVQRQAILQPDEGARVLVLGYRATFVLW